MMDWSVIRRMSDEDVGVAGAFDDGLESRRSDADAAAMGAINSGLECY